MIEEEKELERDMRMLQSMYPETAKLLLPYMEEECDRMEYEGSAMFDQYPDQTTIFRIRESIYQEVQDMLGGGVPMETGVDEMLSMQAPGPKKNPPGGKVGDLIQVMLLHEMHHRRCRHRRWKKRV